MFVKFSDVVGLTIWSAATRELLNFAVPCKVNELIPEGVPFLSDDAIGLIGLRGLRCADSGDEKRVERDD